MFAYSILIFENISESEVPGQRPLANINHLHFSLFGKHKVYVYVIFGYPDIISRDPRSDFGGIGEAPETTHNINRKSFL